MEPERRNVKGADGARLSVCWWPGEGEQFLLVHGLASNALLWAGVAERLAAQGHAVAAVDQRGHGRSDKPDHGYDYDTLSADLAAVADQVGFERPVVAGQSWGGNVAISFAARRPQRVRAVAAIDGGFIDLAGRFESFEACVEVLAPPKLAGSRFDELERRVRTFHRGWPESGIQGSLANFERFEDGTAAPWLSFERHLRILRAMYDEGPSLSYPGVEAPVLFLVADSGDVTWTANKRAGVEAAVAALGAERARAEWLEGDHDLHAQHPERVADVLLTLAGRPA
ncbi:MAG: alpha/beta fold hydrolase [Acidimicrobiales bacterium]